MSLCFLDATSFCESFENHLGFPPLESPSSPFACPVSGARCSFLLPFVCMLLHHPCHVVVLGCDEKRRDGLRREEEREKKRGEQRRREERREEERRTEEKREQNTDMKGFEQIQGETLTCLKGLGGTGQPPAISAHVAARITLKPTPEYSATGGGAHV